MVLVSPRLSSSCTSLHTIETIYRLHESMSSKMYKTQISLYMGALWLSGRVLDSRPSGCGFEPHRHHCIVSLSKSINPSLVHLLVQPRKTCSFITERLLMGCKESNQIKKNQPVYQCSLI